MCICTHDTECVFFHHNLKHMHTYVQYLCFFTGFGSKMLSKMGWRSGQGLGSKGAGIVNPVKATKHTEFGKGLSHMQINKVRIRI